MGAMAKKAESMTGHAFSQYELTTNIITKLNTFNLTPTAKLVLLYLTTCYNPKHKEVFPKQKTIADKIGVSERSVTRAIQELFKEGLVLIECKYTNRYKFTSKIVNVPPRNEDNLCSDNMTNDLGQNDILKGDNLSHHEIEPTIQPYKPTMDDRGGNVYSGDDEILANYAEKHNAKNINAYIAKLKESGSAAKIIKEYNKKRFVQQRALETFKESQNLIKYYESMKNDTCTAASCGCSLSDVMKKINAHRVAASVSV